MYPEFNSFSSIFMGLPDSSSPLVFPHKDLQFATENDQCNFFFRPSLEFQDACQIAPTSEDQEKSVFGHDQREAGQQGQGQEQEQEHGRSDDQVLLEVSSSLKVKLPASVREAGVGDDEEEEDGCKTPTSTDHKISVMVCPPPPRKPKSLPASTNKKRSPRRVFLDLSEEIESLLPPALLADFGNKIKKVRKESFII